jgi:hypothetical protein
MWVTNKTGAVIRVNFEARDVSFPVDEPVEVTDFAARHLFGHGVEDKVPCLVRLGWQQTANDHEKALEKLALVEVSDEKPVKNHSLSPVVEQVVPMPEKARGRKPLHRVA